MSKAGARLVRPPSRHSGPRSSPFDLTTTSVGRRPVPSGKSLAASASFLVRSRDIEAVTVSITALGVTISVTGKSVFE